MNSSKQGALPSQTLRELIESGCIQHARKEYISPASLDLTLSEEIYKIDGLFLPKKGESIRDMLTDMGAHKVSFSDPLQTDHIYLVRLEEVLDLPSSVYGYCNPKSSTGRLDIHVRILADGVPRYDSITPKGFAGELWLAINPKSFSVLLEPGISLSQLRLFNADTRFSELDLEMAMKQYDLMWNRDGERIEYDRLGAHDGDGALILSAYFEDDFCGYVCSAPKDAVLDVKNIKGYDGNEFFSEICPESNILKLEKGKFYILSSAEYVRIPPILASEMVPMDERSGDFRTHYAGFLDPGWGWGADGIGTGRPFTLEVRPFEDLIIRKHQPIAKISFERLSDMPDVHYDEKDSNYLKQSGPRLAKQFK